MPCRRQARGCLQSTLRLSGSISHAVCTRESRLQALLHTTFQSLFDDAPPSLVERYRAAGAVLSVATNSSAIAEAARGSFALLDDAKPAADATMRLWVDETADSFPPWPPAYFRGLSHLVFAAFDRENTALVDLRGRRVLGRFSPAMASDGDYWKRVIFPALFGIVSGSIGVTALHCACVEHSGRALLLAGESGSGKSTLALALARTGFAFLSDDWTFFSRRDGRLLAWSLATPLKLLEPAREHFPELGHMAVARSANGEMAYEIEPEQVFGVRRSASAEPRWLIFLERHDSPGVSFTEISPVDAAARFESELETLPPAVSGSRDFLVKTIRILVQRSCWLLRFGEKPEAVARAVADFFGIDTRPVRSGEPPSPVRAGRL